ncbi:MAG TPA: CDP-glucose 4,6-dehydratase [Hyphomicrobiaceae bacterium]|nr:CDP-glucose 4,6-dehydratase [Hyphomicrobiaceae bacterium]
MGFGPCALENMGLGTEFWKGRRVLVTGHTGFKGSWLSEWLLALGADVAGYALAPPTDPALFDQLGLGRRLKHQIGDIRDLRFFRACAEAHDPEVVFHLAAQPLVRYSYQAPIETYEVNVLGTAHVLDVCRGLPRLRAVVVVTTDKCYENHEWLWGYREVDRLGGHDPYSSSKACTEILADSFRRSFFQAGAHIASARAGNVIGGGDWATDRLIPDVARAVRKREEVVIRYPDSIRPWQHVLEPLHGYLALAEALCGPGGRQFAESWNFGPDDQDARPVRWIMEYMSRAWPEFSRWRTDERAHPHEAGYLRLDCSKAHARLQWRPRLSLEQALKLTVEWYSAHQRGDDLRALTGRQIHDFSQLI